MNLSKYELELVNLGYVQNTDSGVGTKVYRKEYKYQTPNGFNTLTFIFDFRELEKKNTIRLMCYLDTLNRYVSDFDMNSAPRLKDVVKRIEEDKIIVKYGDLD